MLQDSKKIINGKLIADNFLSKISKASTKFIRLYGNKPCLAVIIVGEDPASRVYVNNKIKTAKSINFKSVEIILPLDTKENELLVEIEKLNHDDQIDGILVQLPLPKHISEKNVINKISPQKDVDGFHPLNFGNLALGYDTIVPCTPLGCMHLIKKEIKNLSGYNVTIIGRSNIVGKPMQALLLKENCTVTIAHSKTINLKKIAKEADILISAIGKPEFVTKEFIKPDCIIIDIGINKLYRNGKPKLVGDVKFEEAFLVAKKITPVPGGVGPMTIACLMHNTLKTAYSRKNKIFNEKID